MPKPNGYFFYMQAMRDETPQWRGKSNADLSLLCSKGWNSLTSQEKQPYNDMKHTSGIALPKSGRKVIEGQRLEKGETDLGGQDSLGRSLYQIHLSNNESARKFEVEENWCALQAQDLVRNNNFRKEFYVVKITNYCITEEMVPKVYVPAEVSIGAFNIYDGLSKTKKLNAFCKAEIPFGFTLEVKTTSEDKLKLPFPFHEAKPYNKVAQMISDFVVDTVLASNINNGADETLAQQQQQNQEVVLFTHPKHRETCIQNLAAIFGGQNKIPFKVMSLADLVAGFYNYKTDNDKISSTAMGECLHHDKIEMDLTDKFCELHETTDNPVCSTAILTLWIKSARKILQTAGYRVQQEKQYKPKSTVPENFQW